jgi:hypothetical protein
LRAHFGSTAVPGLAAKPVIDILVTVEDPDDETATVPALTAVGYQLRVREPGHRMFRTSQRNVHVHVWGDADTEVKRHLRFRDRLRHSPDDRRAYEQVKRELAQRDWPDMNCYPDAKHRGHPSLGSTTEQSEYRHCCNGPIGAAPSRPEGPSRSPGIGQHEARVGPVPAQLPPARLTGVPRPVPAAPR